MVFWGEKYILLDGEAYSFFFYKGLFLCNFHIIRWLNEYGIRLGVILLFA